MEYLLGQTAGGTKDSGKKASNTEKDATTLQKAR